MKVRKTIMLDKEVIDVIKENIGDGCHSAYINDLIRWDIRRCNIKLKINPKQKFWNC